MSTEIKVGDVVRPRLWEGEVVAEGEDWIYVFVAEEQRTIPVLRDAVEKGAARKPTIVGVTLDIDGERVEFVRPPF